MNSINIGIVLHKVQVANVRKKGVALFDWQEALAFHSELTTLGLIERDVAREKAGLFLVPMRRDVALRFEPHKPNAVVSFEGKSLF